MALSLEELDKIQENQRKYPEIEKLFSFLNKMLHPMSGVVYRLRLWWAANKFENKIDAALMSKVHYDELKDSGKTVIPIQSVEPLYRNFVYRFLDPVLELLKPRFSKKGLTLDVKEVYYRNDEIGWLEYPYVFFTLSFIKPETEKKG